MTVENIYTPPTYTGNGTTTDFSFPFPFFSPTEIIVTIFDNVAAADLGNQPVLNGAQANDYTVIGVQDLDTGEYLAGCTVRFNSAPPANYDITIFRNVLPTQILALTNNARFPAKSLEGTGLDRAMMVIQQLYQLFGALLAASPGGLDGKIIGFINNGSGQGLTAVDPIAVTTLTGTLNFVIGDSTNAIGTGYAGELGPYNFDMTLQQVTLTGDAIGSIVLDFKTCSYSDFPNNQVSIVGSAPPTLATARKSQDGALTGWSPIVTAGKYITINVNSVSGLKRCTVAVKYNTPAPTNQVALDSFNTQFRALQAEFESGFAGVLAGVNGYQKLPSGLILQWGKYVGGSSNPTITFPLAFPSACYNVVCTPFGLSADTNDFANNNAVREVNLDNANPPTATQFTVFCSAEHGVEDVFHAETTTNFHWMAIGK